jgi:hypothetical protein
MVTASVYLRWPAAILLLLAAEGAHAASVFRCVDARGLVAYQASPCAAGARQSSIELRSQPLIDASALRYASPNKLSNRHVHTRHGNSHQRKVSNRVREDEQPVSYECRAADGEVFYRHARCPGSVPGDGIARFGADQARTSSRSGRRNSRTGAWAAIPVTAHKVPRAEACRQINATAAADRDGHARDEQVSVYEHDLGRDPCRGF